MYNWCSHTRLELYRIGLGQSWENQAVPRERSWKDLGRDRIRLADEAEWRKDVAEKTKLDSYRAVKTSLG